MSSDEKQERREPEFPQNWRIGADFDPNNHLMQLKGRDYMNVQNRLLWFIRDQRAFTIAGLAKVPFTIQTDLVEIDRTKGWAHFKTTVRDVLGNESTMYGSESAQDFGDYAEKASTKSLGRALLALGYGTAFAPEMDEGERVVDAPVERRNLQRAPRTTIGRPQAVSASTIAEEPLTQAYKSETSQTSEHVSDQPAATEQQIVSIHKLCAALGKDQPAQGLSYNQARQLITQLSAEYQQQRSRRAS